MAKQWFKIKFEIYKTHFTDPEIGTRLIKAHSRDKAVSKLIKKIKNEYGYQIFNIISVVPFPPTFKMNQKIKRENEKPLRLKYEKLKGAVNHE